MTDKDSALIALKAAILDAVERSGGAKSTKLVADVVLAIGGQTVDSDLADLLEELINAGEIVEVQYTLPDKPFYKHYFLLPKGSKIAMFKAGKSAVIFTPDGDVEMREGA